MAALEYLHDHSKIVGPVVRAQSDEKAAGESHDILRTGPRTRPAQSGK